MGVMLDDPVSRLVLLVDPAGSPASKILALAGGRHQDILVKLEEQQTQTILKAYEQARTQLVARMDKLWADTFGAGLPVEPKHVIEWARGDELLSTIDTHLEALGVKTQALQGQAWNAGAALGLEHANTELGLALDDFGGIAALGKSTFGNLTTIVPDLGMAAAINETKNLGDVMKAEVHSQLTQGAVLGEGIKKIEQRLDGVLQGATVPAGSRAELISRWATVKGYNAAASQALADASTVIPGLQQIWLVERDERTCPHCMSHWGETADAGEEFDASRSFANTPIKPYGGVLEYPPLHPRCRCTITAWHPRWEGISTVTPTQLQQEAQVLAQQNGFAPKSFPPQNPPTPGSLRSTRAGRNVIRAQSIAAIPEGIKQATLEKFLTCWVGG